MPLQCHENINDLIEKKKIVKELDEEPRVKCLDEWIESILKYTDDDVKHSISDANERKSLNDYDEVLHSILNLKF